MDSQLVQALKRFNRKERFWLLSDAVGKPFASLSPAFLSKVGTELGIELPANPWWAFDYHFDWLHAVLTLGPEYNLSALPKPLVNEPKIATGNQEDIDLLIAFDQTIILIEAKLSASWTNDQMKSKARRMSALPVQHVQPYFILTSPSKPKNLNLSGLPPWAVKSHGGMGQPCFMELSRGGDQERALMVSRCDERGVKNALGGHWNIFEA
ncbi:hypothetical protein ABZT49_09950 [Methylobacterium sp. EM32]|uniref:hypothetical protein n=1 Tax=Methylobacterium sp. EM32 TaxID=3163481 RepID=UPI00339F5C62